MEALLRGLGLRLSGRSVHRWSIRRDLEKVHSGRSIGARQAPGPLAGPFLDGPEGDPDNSRLLATLTAAALCVAEAVRAQRDKCVRSSVG
jgi:hypothetical protein